MERTKILVIKNQYIEDGSVSKNTDTMIRNGWRVNKTYHDGSILMEKDKRLIYLGIYDEQESQSEEKKSGS